MAEINIEKMAQNIAQKVIQELRDNGVLIGRWIPVSERLPKDDERVLVTRRMFHWANEPAEYAVGIESFSGNIDFVAWMPLPEPYKASPTDSKGASE